MYLSFISMFQVQWRLFATTQVIIDSSHKEVVPSSVSEAAFCVACYVHNLKWTKEIFRAYIWHSIEHIKIGAHPIWRHWHSYRRHQFSKNHHKIVLQEKSIENCPRYVRALQIMLIDNVHNVNKAKSHNRVPYVIFLFFLNTSLTCLNLVVFVDVNGDVHGALSSWHPFSYVRWCCAKRESRKFIS